jgi:hypothetical protein
MSNNPIEAALERLAAGAKLVLWRMSSPWNWYLLDAAGGQHPLSAETALAILPKCEKESDSPNRVPNYRIGTRRGHDANMPESTHYVLTA